MEFKMAIEPCCAYCSHVVPISDTEAVCLRRGIVSLEGHCRKFQYDPLKRVPDRPPQMPTREYSQEDFTL